MKHYIYKKDRLKMTSFAIVYDAGSELETTGKKGTMHLMEHLICKTFEHMYPTLTARGIDWNAYTSEDKVVVWFEGLSSCLTAFLKTELVKYLTGGLNIISEDVFNKEKHVVLQEYMDCVFDNTYACYMNVFRRYWNDYAAIGKEEDIKNFTYQDMLDVYEKHFKYPVRIIDISPEKTEGLEVFCKDSEHKHSLKKFGNYDNELVESDTTLKTPVYMLFPKIVKPSDYPYVKIGLSMLVDGLESPYYQELRVKRSLSYYVEGSIDKNIKGGIMTISACTDTNRADELCQQMDILSNCTYDLLSAERFDNIMNKLKINREKQKILKYAYIDKYANISKLKMPEKLDNIELSQISYLMSRYFADMKIIKGSL